MKFLYHRLYNFIIWHCYYKFSTKWKNELKRASNEAYETRKRLIGK